MSFQAKWTKLRASNLSTRSSHCVSVVPTGSNTHTLYVFGGEHEARHVIDSQLHALDLVNGEAKNDFRVVEAKGSLPSPRFAQGQCVVKEGNTHFIYIFGGRQGITMDEAPLNDMYKFNVETETWSEVTVSGSPPSKRSFHRMVAVGAKLYVFGGCDAAGRCADMSEFDTASSTWTTLPAAPLKGRGGPNLLASADGKSLFVVAGFAGEETNDICQFDLQTQKWTAHDGEAMRKRSVCISDTLEVGGSGGTFVVIGGEVDPSAKGHEGAGDFAGDVVLINGDNGALLSVKEKGEKFPARGWSAGASLGSNSLIVVGGLAGNDTSPIRLNDVWRLDITPSSGIEEKAAAAVAAAATVAQTAGQKAVAAGAAAAASPTGQTVIGGVAKAGAAVQSAVTAAAASPAGQTVIAGVTKAAGAVKGAAAAAAASPAGQTAIAGATKAADAVKGAAVAGAAAVSAKMATAPAPAADAAAPASA